MRVMVSGHRPPGVGGYRTPNPTEQWVRANLRAILVGIQKKHPDVTTISGMALGVDTIFAEVCIELGIPFIAAVPFEGQGSRWPDESKSRYNHLLTQAKKVVIVDEIPSYCSDTFGGKMALRNKWSLDHSDLVVAVWNGDDGGTGNTVKQARRQKRKIMRLNPRTFKVSVEKPPVEGPDVFDMFGSNG